MAAKVSPRDFRCDWLGIPTRKLLKWIASGVCPAPFVVDATARWHAADLEKWEASGFPRSEPPTVEALHSIRCAILAEELARDITEEDK